MFKFNTVFAVISTIITILAIIACILVNRVHTNFNTNTTTQTISYKTPLSDTTSHVYHNASILFLVKEYNTYYPNNHKLIGEELTRAFKQCKTCSNLK